MKSNAPLSKTQSEPTKYMADEAADQVADKEWFWLATLLGSIRSRTTNLGSVEVQNKLDRSAISFCSPRRIKSRVARDFAKSRSESMSCDVAGSMSHWIKDLLKQSISSPVTAAIPSATNPKIFQPPFINPQIPLIFGSSRLFSWPAS